MTIPDKLLFHEACQKRPNSEVCFSYAAEVVNSWTILCRIERRDEDEVFVVGWQLVCIDCHWKGVEVGSLVGYRSDMDVCSRQS